jgi:hypothetical protein
MIAGPATSGSWLLRCFDRREGGGADRLLSLIGPIRGYCSPMDPTTPSQPSPGRSTALWFLLACSIAALAVALVPFASLLARHAPIWLAIGAGLVVFPILPLVWHGVAVVVGRDGGPLLTAPSRFAARSLAVALLVLGVSFGNLGPEQLGKNLSDLIGRVRAKPAAKPAAPIPTPSQATSAPLAMHGLEPFLPADATLVVGLSGSAAMEQLLAAHGVDTREKLAALATCKIDFVNARVLIAKRGSGTEMIVVRAPGITEERNLYCLVGVMGRERIEVRAEGSGSTKTLHVTGILSRPIAFRPLDETTVIATDESWQDTVDNKLFVNGNPSGHLAVPLLRVDRTAPLWVASVDEMAQGTWDLALDSRQEGNLFKLRGSATPPSGEGDRAEISLRVPLAFARALPESAVALGIRGVVAAVLATSASLPTGNAAPAPPVPTAPVPVGGRAP